MVTGPDLRHEHALWSSAMTNLAGMDEAGRGAIAGPVVAAIVCCGDRCIVERLLNDNRSSLIRDSKTLSYAQRLRARDLIAGTFEHSAVGAVSSMEIDAVGIAAANRMAMERALRQLDHRPDFLLIDACTIDSGIPQWGLIDGDAQSVLIAAASILAKVTRDQMMEQFGEQYRAFSFGQHRGYGTAIHLEELRQHGPCPIHRRSFAPVSAVSGESS